MKPLRDDELLEEDYRERIYEKDLNSIPNVHSIHQVPETIRKPLKIKPSRVFVPIEKNYETLPMQGDEKERKMEKLLENDIIEWRPL